MSGRIMIYDALNTYTTKKAPQKQICGASIIIN